MVVTNLHLYGIDVATGGQILPEHELAIFDEAHQTEDILAHACGSELRGGRFTALVRSAGAILMRSRVLEEVDELAGRLAAVLARHMGHQLVPADDGVLRSALELAKTRLSRLHAELLDVPRDGPGDVAARRARALQSLEALADDIGAALDLDSGPIPGPKVAWVDGRPDRHSTWHP